MSQKRRKFSPQFNAEAVQFVIETGRPINEIARELEIHKRGSYHVDPEMGSFHVYTENRLRRQDITTPFPQGQTLAR